ncbi:spore gernimation protein GerC [Paenibacillus sp. P25]|nr:spore gernimation protein GerC [Paenibacillus sp. P25]
MSTVRRILILVALCLLPGCWDIQTIQDVNYITAIGLDYQDGKYVLYTRLLDFASVAKKQDGKPSEPAPVWTGKGTGETVDIALNQMYKEAQQKLFFGHVNAIVLSENILKTGNTEVLDGFMRLRESRYMAWVFGTRKPIEEVFTARPFFGLSPLSSILHNPTGVYKERSFLQPVKFQRFMALLKEPGNTVLLQSISVDSSVWKKK